MDKLPAAPIRDIPKTQTIGPPQAPKEACEVFTATEIEALKILISWYNVVSQSNIDESMVSSGAYKLIRGKTAINEFLRKIR